MSFLRKPVPKFCCLGELVCGAVGIVVSINRERRLKPKVLLVLNEKKERITPPRIIDLAKFDPAKYGAKFDVKSVVQGDAYGINILDYIIPNNKAMSKIA